ncbi:MAG: TonB-dependent receptor, partial [Spirochaetaceae bacterium]|nr:TonB-dependent receptor [Spirochaetaceae bacterium]
DIAQFTPNLEIRTPFAASNPTLFIRGVGLRDFNANSSSSVAVYNDDIYMNSPAGQLAQLFDVENVDVLRGPQGGIYGRNASAGAIRVISRKPTGINGGYVNFTYGRFEQVEVQAAAETPLVDDLLSLRIAGKMSRRGGTTHNRCGDVKYAANPGLPPLQSFAQRVHNFCFNSTVLDTPIRPGFTVGQTPSVKEWVNDVNNWAMRALLRFQPDVLDGMDWLLNVHGGQNRGDARQFQLLGAEQGRIALQPTITRSIATRDRDNYIDPDNQFRTPGNTGLQLDGIPQSPFRGDPFAGDYNNVEKEILDLFGANIVGDITVGDWQLKTITGYEWNRRDVELNLDGSPYRSLEPTLKNTSYQLTQELRAAWDRGTGLNAQIAAMFLYEGLNVDNTFSLSPFDARIQRYTLWTRYAAVFGELEWESGEAFSVNGGIRLNYENKEINLFSQAVNPLFQTVIFTQAEKSEAEELGLAGDVTLSYLPTNDVTFYVKYAHGWKGPHINGGISNPTTSSETPLTEPVKPEQVDSFEAGLKSLWWDSRLKVNGAIFYYDYNDIQVFRLRNSSAGVPVNELINAKDADILGVELDFDVRPFDGIGPEILSGFSVYASFAWLQSQYTDFVNVISTTQDVVVGGQVQKAVTQSTFDFSGAQLINSPKFSFVGFAQWMVPTPYGSVTPRFDWSFKDDVYFSPENSPLVGQSALWLMNFRVTYRSPGENLELSGWVENMTDQAYTVDVFNLARFRRSILYAIGDPRTYGLTLRVRF